MTTITVKKIKEVYDIKLEGHANYQPGNDIVCAGVSALTFALAQKAVDMEGEGKGVVAEKRLEPGNTRITFLPDKETEEEWKIALSTIVEGYNLIAAIHPANVKVINWVGEIKKERC
ncbi:MAG: ribosomal-processing cysteine protease Prp [Lachnospiraceae bacterium]|jgi:uncharacterized protein YsxB (DUF464 family)